MAAEPPGPEEPPTEPLAALAHLLETLRRECLAALRGGDLAGLAPLGASDLEWLNTELAGIRQLNAALPHTSRRAAVKTWPSPVLPPHILIGPRDVLAVLDPALAVLTATRAYRATWLYQHRLDQGLAPPPAVPSAEPAAPVAEAAR